MLLSQHCTTDMQLVLDSGAVLCVSC
jgi:hypothetical protein